ASRSPGWLFNENLFKSLNTITHPKTLVSTPEGHANPNRDYWTDALVGHFNRRFKTFFRVGNIALRLLRGYRWRNIL
ncbi:MAG TPA: hypothetical protein V6D26_01335, partial [Stenomitos sp.]